MRSLLTALFCLFLLTGCASSQPPVVTNPNSGQYLIGSFPTPDSKIIVQIHFDIDTGFHRVDVYEEFKNTKTFVWGDELGECWFSENGSPLAKPQDQCYEINKAKEAASKLSNYELTGPNSRNVARLMHERFQSTPLERL